jgi:replication-associated recombination protein RarA
VPTFSSMETPGGFKCGEVASAFQKAIRRGEEREAIFWATELDLTGYGNYVWKRMRVIASEDVGLADPHLTTTIRTLYENWKESRKGNEYVPYAGGKLFFIHAVILLARAQKSRMVDHALMVFYEGDREAMGMEIPDHALDRHTGRGRKMGRGQEHFFEEGAQLANRADMPDPYEEEGRANRTAKEEAARFVQAELA